MPDLMVSILLLSVSCEMRHESSAVLLMVETESLSALVPFTALELVLVLVWLDSSPAGTLWWFPVPLLWFVDQGVSCCIWRHSGGIALVSSRRLQLFPHAVLK